MGWGVVGVWMAFPFGLTSAGLMLGGVSTT